MRFTKAITLLTWPDQSIDVTIRFWLQRLSKNALFLATVILVIPSLQGGGEEGGEGEDKEEGRGGWRRRGGRGEVERRRVEEGETSGQ